VGDEDKGASGGRDGVTFTSKVGKGNDGSSWFPNKPVGPRFPPGVAAIGTVTPGGKKHGAGATKEEALAAAGLMRVRWIGWSRSREGWMEDMMGANRLNATKSPIVY